MATVDAERIEQLARSIPSGWKDGQGRTRPRRMTEMQRRPGRWWRKVEWLAKQRRHNGFRRACIYLLELRAVMDAEVFLPRLSFFRRAQRRRKDLILFLNEAGLTVPGEPATWEELVAAYPLKPRRWSEWDDEGAAPQRFDLLCEDDDWDDDGAALQPFDLFREDDDRDEEALPF